MKLAEAIRLGAMNRPPGYCLLAADGRTCALGAALDAIGVYDEINPRYDVVAREWPWLESNIDQTRFPAQLRDWLGEDAKPQSSWWVITKANDEQLMTREEIADWVATIEPKDDTVITVQITFDGTCVLTHLTERSA